MLQKISKGMGSLTGKFILSAIGLLTAIFVVEILVVTSRGNAVISDLALKHSREVGAHHAAQVEGQLNRRMVAVEAVSRSFAMLRRSWVTDRAAYNGIIRAMIEGDKGIYSLWAVFEPGAIDADSDHPDDIGSNAEGRFAPLWYREEGQIKVDAIADLADKGAAGRFYYPAVQGRNLVITEPYTFKVGNVEQDMVSLVSPVIVDRRVIGAVGIIVPLSQFNDELGKVHPLDSGRVSLVTNGGNWAAVADIAALGKPVTGSHMTQVNDAVKGGQPLDFTAGGADGTEQNYLLPIAINGTATPWGLLVSIPLVKVFEPAAAIRNLVIGAKLIALVTLTLTLALAGLWVVRRPLARSIAVIERMAQGDYQVVVCDTGRGDEIGQVNRALQIFQGNLSRIARLEEERRQAEQQSQAARKAEMIHMADTFEAALSGISTAVSEGAGRLQRNAEHLSGIAENTSQQARTVASASEQATGNVQSVASAVTELVASVDEISRQIHQSADVARAAVDKVGHTNQAMDTLVEAARRIGDVTGFIHKIAAQTNLLALNATIEAARAAEAGKGFAVVAGEVKSLASQTATATEDIRQQIQNMQTATSDVAQSIHAVGEMISVISENIHAVASAAGEQGAVTEEISRSLQLAAGKTVDVSDNISGVTRVSGETGRMADDVLHASQDLSVQASTLENEVRNFISTIRST